MLYLSSSWLYSPCRRFRNISFAKEFENTFFLLKSSTFALEWLSLFHRMQFSETISQGPCPPLVQDWKWDQVFMIWWFPPGNGILSSVAKNVECKSSFHYKYSWCSCLSAPYLLISKSATPPWCYCLKLCIGISYFLNYLKLFSIIYLTVFTLFFSFNMSKIHDNLLGILDWGPEFFCSWYFKMVVLNV